MGLIRMNYLKRSLRTVFSEGGNTYEIVEGKGGVVITSESGISISSVSFMNKLQVCSVEHFPSKR